MKSIKFDKKKFPEILSIGTSNPENSYTQEDIYKMCGYNNKKIRSIFLNCEISKRHMFFTPHDPIPFESLDQLHRRYREGSISLGMEAIKRCLAKANMNAGDMDFVISVSCTGYLCPGLSSIMVRKFNMKRNVQRTDIQGMGCCGAIPSLQRAYDHIMAYPEHKVLLFCVEICSAAYYIENSMETIIGNAICGDGAAAMIIGRGHSPSGPRILDFQSLVDSSYLDSVGFLSDKGRLRIVLSKEIQKVAGSSVAAAVKELLVKNGLSKAEIKHWVIHPGGRNVIENIIQKLGLAEENIRHSKSILKNYGNMSSPTVIFVLDEIIREENPKRGEFGVMIALGPGLAAETVLLQW